MQDTDKDKRFDNHCSDTTDPMFKGEKCFVSKGEVIHNEITYRGVDWFVNSAVGVAFSYATSKTEAGKKYFGKPVSAFFKKILSPVLKNPAHLEEGSKWGTMFASIMAGGTAIIPVMLKLENKETKKAIIRNLDEKIYGKEAVENDPKFAAAYKAIDEEPEKDFKTGMIARFIAIAPLITIASIPATNKPMIKYVYDPIGKMSKFVAEKMGIRPAKMMKEGVMELVEGDPNLPKKFMSNWDYLHRTIGFDFGLTFFYAILHEMAFEGLSKMGVKNKPQSPQLNPSDNMATLKGNHSSATDNIPQPAEKSQDNNPPQSYSFTSKLEALQNQSGQGLQVV